MGHHSNPSSRYKNRKNHAKRNEEFEYSKRKANIERENKAKRDIKSKKKKSGPNFPEEFNIINTSDRIGLYFRIPVKWGLFGTLNKNSQILLNNILRKNYDVITGYVDRKDPSDRQYSIDLNKTKRKSLLLFNTKKIYDNRVKAHYLDRWVRNSDGIFTYKHGKVWYIYIPIRVRNVCKWNWWKYDCDTNYVELKTHVYDKYDIKNFKIRGYKNRCHVQLAFANSLLAFEKGPWVYDLNNIYPEVTKKQDSDKDINCIYRIYTKENHVLADPEVEQTTNKSIYKDLCKLYVYAIPNVVRYKRTFNKVKLPKNRHN